MDTPDCKRCAWCYNVNSRSVPCSVPAYRTTEVGEGPVGLSIGTWTNKRATVSALGCKYYARKPVLICPRLDVVCEWRKKKYDPKYDNTNVCTRSVFDFCFCTEYLPQAAFDQTYGYKVHELVFTDRKDESAIGILQRLAMHKMAMSIPAYKGVVRY
jgi:hypothetical protein